VYLRLPQQYVAVLNGFLIGLIAYFSALGVRNLIRLHVVAASISSLPSSTRPKPLATPEVGLRPRAYYNLIVQRNIFSRTPVEPAAVTVREEPLDVTLVGTSQRSNGKHFIIVESPDGEQALYRQGDIIPRVGRVLSISRDQAIVLHNGHPVALKIPSAGENGTPALSPFMRKQHGIKRPPRFPRRRELAPASVLDSHFGVHQLGPNRYLVSRATFDHDLSNLRSLLTQIRAVPNLQNGSTKGFRLSQIEPGSIFQQIGLENGDIVTGAQDREVRDPIGAMVLVSALRNSPSISLNIIRNGTPLKIDYTIR
jgi:type II secretion system protein C